MKLNYSRNDKNNQAFLKLPTKNKPQTPANPFEKIREGTMPIVRNVRPELDDV